MCLYRQKILRIFAAAFQSILLVGYLNCITVLAQKLWTLRHYLLHQVKAGTEHGLHPPFVYRLYSEVIRPQKHYYAYTHIEALRTRLLQSKDRLEVTDLGAGSRVNKQRVKSIQSIVKNAEKPPRIAQMLYRLVDHFRPQTIFDLGTSLGLTTLYLASANQEAQVVSFEGCPATANRARQHFKELAAHNIEVITGNIDNTLLPAINKIDKLDFAFFDANHRYEPTIAYFETCLAKAHEDSVFVMDDIYWSAEMTAAWKYICRHPSVMITVDLFEVGLVFFRKKQPRQHFRLKL
jgi:predicted O-methyltransferase YrrM